ncbi:MAG: L-carnitine dehydrogenase [Pseudomonadales bacterium]|jgi:carnitine 3-dehydrogenase|nr:L-carnitine dehydrogenase [Pseudomonadales bacterium]MDA0956835.1 L-carnitine dehydrogenase [Pseudomonadota bacterium]MDA1207263.1 L-carnitine dehydrogenase [Pseudomonadota bacterium]
MQTIAIIGTGVIGTGWAIRCLAHGIRVNAWDPAPDFQARLNKDVRRLWPLLQQQGLTQTPEPAEIHCHEALSTACQGVDFVQESAPEDLLIKQSLHREIDAATDPETPVASSSSGLLPTEIQAVYQHPGRCLIGHPFNPVYLLPLVEVVGGQLTHSTTLETATKFYEQLSMKPLRVRNEIEGYLSDRLQEALWREALHLVNDGIATTEELDNAITYGPGLRWAFMGTCLTFHLAGGKQGMRHMLEQFGPALKLPWTKLEAPELSDTLIERMVSGTQAQAGSRSIEELESLRDNCLIELMAVVEKYRSQGL